jgi:hypothetical protein
MLDSRAKPPLVIVVAHQCVDFGEAAVDRCPDDGAETDSAGNSRRTAAHQPVSSTPKVHAQLGGHRRVMQAYLAQDKSAAALKGLDHVRVKRSDTGKIAKVAQPAVLGPLRLVHGDQAVERGLQFLVTARLGLGDDASAMQLARGVPDVVAFLV